MQTRKRSAIEAVTNVVVGFVTAIFSQELIFPLFGFHIPLSEHMLIGSLFTVISLVRSYVLRRIFNQFDGKS